MQEGECEGEETAKGPHDAVSVPWGHRYLKFYFNVLAKTQHREKHRA